jgi:hypothetical protein
MADEGFLTRWSRRKRAANLDAGAAADGETAPPVRHRGVMDSEPDGPTVVEPAAPEATLPQTAAPPEAMVADATEAEADLPPIEALDDSSDYSAFMRDGVSDKLRSAALRKLWRSNPVLANLDGLNDYDEDFSDAAVVVEGVKSLYRVGKGMPGPAELEQPDEVAEAAVETAEDTSKDEAVATTGTGTADPAEGKAATETGADRADTTAGGDANLENLSPERS